MSKSIYIVWCHDDILSKLVKYVNLSTKFNLLGSNDNGVSAFLKIKATKPQVVIISNEIRGIDGIGLINKICTIENYQPNIFFYSACTIVDRIIDYNKNITFHLKPVTANMIYNEVINKIKFLRPIDEQIKQILFELKIPVKLKGYMYLRYAAEVCHENPEVMYNLSKNLYPKICEKFDAICVLNVEKAIKNAVIAGYKNNIHQFPKVPSNKEILRYILNELKKAV